MRPTTKIPQPVSIAGAKGGLLTFWDMPGIGESGAADDGYLREYRRLLEEADVVLWAMHADSRSTTLDVSALRVLLADDDPSQQRKLFSKITFVLTKADQVNPTPWIYAQDGKSGTFQPSPSTSGLLAEKARFFRECLMAPFGHLAQAQTFNDVGGFAVDDPRFESDEFHITYHGLMDEGVVEELCRQYPQYGQVFERLAVNHRVIACSTRFRFDLLPLLVTTVNKLGESAVRRFTNVLDAGERLDRVPALEAASYCNMVVWDLRTRQRKFDLTQTIKG